MPLPSALVLDLDGTLIDSAADLADAANALLSEFGRPQLSVEAIRGMVGNGLAVLAVRAMTATGPAPDPAEGQDLGRILLKHYLNPKSPPQTLVFPGVVEILESMREQGVLLGLCTNKAQTATEAVLDKTGLAGYFDTVVGYDLTPAPKPDAAHVQTVLDRLGNPVSAVMVGDSPIDLMAGKSAGLAVVLVTYGYGTDEALAAADAKIDHFSDLPIVLPPLVEKLG